MIHLCFENIPLLAGEWIGGAKSESREAATGSAYILQHGPWEGTVSDPGGLANRGISARLSRQGSGEGVNAGFNCSFAGGTC